MGYQRSSIISIPSHNYVHTIESKVWEVDTRMHVGY